MNSKDIITTAIKIISTRTMPTHAHCLKCLIKGQFNEILDDSVIKKTQVKFKKIGSNEKMILLNRRIAQKLVTRTVEDDAFLEKRFFFKKLIFHN